MQVDEDDDDLMLFAEDQSDRDISLDIDLSRNNHLQPSSRSKYQPLKQSRGAGSRIEVVVRKRPLNSGERGRGETDIAHVERESAKLKIAEPRLKVDLTKYTQYHEFTFDHCFDEHSTNAQIYETSVRPLFDTILQPGPNSKYAGKATCFGYGQTGSGKTYTLLGSHNERGEFNEGLYAMAVRDLFEYLPANNRIIVSFYEIYGGKLYDLLNGRKHILCREDGKQKVNIIGLRRMKCEDAESLMEVIADGNQIRQTGSTGANNASSRSHAILSMDILPIRGRISFIDLAGSERGADTANNNKQTRIEGAEINKSLLALKECIRALDMNSVHKPFRGSKLTQVLKESFMGNSRTLMVANISPNSGSCENTLNTLRYAYRVKELKNGGTSNQRGLSRNRSAPNLTEKNHSRPSTARSKKKNPSKNRKKLQSVNTRYRNDDRGSNERNIQPPKSRRVPTAKNPSQKRARSPASPATLRPLKSSKNRSRTPTERRTPKSPRSPRALKPLTKNSSPMSSKLKPLPPNETRSDSKYRGRDQKGTSLPPMEQHDRRHDQRQERSERVPRSERQQQQRDQDDDEVTREREPMLNSSLSKKQLIKAHRRHIDEFMLLIKEDMQLLKCFDKDEFGNDEYQQKLRKVLDQQEQAVQRYKRKVFN